MLCRLIPLLSLVISACGALAAPPATSPALATQPISHHPRLDLARWCREFPLDQKTRQDAMYLYPNANSPRGIAITEQLRAEVSKQVSLGRSVPVDIIVWAEGEPAKPYLTRVGGIPYRSQSLAWPTAADGTRMTFLAQFCFLDSRDILPPNLPGDVLLVFLKTPASWAAAESDDVHLEWVKFPVSDPIQPAACPPSAFPVPKFAGEIHRTVEYPDSAEVWEKLKFRTDYLWAHGQSTKIGPEAWFIQHDPRRKGEVLLCTLDSFGAWGRWPFTNRESIVDSGKGGMTGDGEYQMIFDDSGCMYFLLASDGRTRCVGDCY